MAGDKNHRGAQYDLKMIPEFQDIYNMRIIRLILLLHRLVVKKNVYQITMQSRQMQISLLA